MISDLCFSRVATQLFKWKSTFNEDISGWKLANLTTMESMFDGAYAFNQPLEQWNVANVTTMDRMFAGATAFHGNAEGFPRPLLTSTDGEGLGRWKVVYKEAKRFNALVIGEHVRADRKRTDGSAARVAVGLVARVLTMPGLAGEIAAFLFCSVKD